MHRAENKPAIAWIEKREEKKRNLYYKFHCAVEKRLWKILFDTHNSNNFIYLKKNGKNGEKN